MKIYQYDSVEYLEYYIYDCIATKNGGFNINYVVLRQIHDAVSTVTI